MGAKFIINNKRYIDAYDNTNDMDKPYIRTKKAIKNHSIINKNYYIKAADKDNDGDKTNNAKIYSKKKKKTYYLVANIIPKKDFTYTDPSTGEVFSGLYKYAERKMTKQGNIISDTQLLQKHKDELTNIKPVGSAFRAFSNCNYMTDLKEVETTWDTSEITDMSQMFLYFGQSKRNQVNGRFVYEKIEFDMTSWDFSNVTTMDSMFSGCAGLRKLHLPEQGIVAPKLTSIHGMFNNAISLEEVPIIIAENAKDFAFALAIQGTFTYFPKWNTSSAETMYRMFSECTNLKKVEQINTSKVKNFEGMFYYCQNLEEIPELDTSSAEYMGLMFMGCTKLPSEFPWTIDCSGITKLQQNNNNWIDLKGMQYMFRSSSVRTVRLKNLKDNLKMTESKMASYLGVSTVIYEN